MFIEFYNPFFFDQVEIDLAREPTEAAICFIFSSIFSYILGTAINIVGQTSFRVSIKEPLKASGFAK